MIFLLTLYSMLCTSDGVMESEYALRGHTRRKNKKYMRGILGTSEYPNFVTHDSQVRSFFQDRKSLHVRRSWSERRCYRKASLFLDIYLIGISDAENFKGGMNEKSRI